MYYLVNVDHNNKEAPSHQKWMWRVLWCTVHPVEWMSLMMICFGMTVEDENVRSEYNEDKGTDNEDGDSDTASWR